MFSELNTKICDRLLAEMDDGADEGRALKALRNYRRHPSDALRDAALVALNRLSDVRLGELKQVARI